MAQKALGVTIAAILVLSTVAFGASAFTSATVEREASIQVVDDQSGPLRFTKGATGVATTQNGELAIDVSNLDSASGINRDASYTFGNASADDASSVSKTDYVFSTTNTDNVTHEVSLTYLPDNSSVGPNNVVFEVYRLGDGTSQGALATEKSDQAGSTASFSAEPGVTYHVVVTFDTGVDGTDMTTASDLSGTLTVQV